MRRTYSLPLSAYGVNENPAADLAGCDPSRTEGPGSCGDYDVSAGIASNSCPADFSVDVAALASSDARVTRIGPGARVDMGGGLTFTDDSVTAAGGFDATAGTDQLQLDFDESRFTGTLTRRLPLCSVTFSVQGERR